MKKMLFLLIILAALFLTYCSDSTSNNDDIAKISISHPAAGTTITETITTLLAELQTKTEVDSVEFLVDDFGIGYDSSSPYSYQWNNFYWADGQQHTITVKAHRQGLIVGTDSLRVTVSQQAGTFPELVLPIDSIQVSNPIQFIWKSLPGEPMQYEVMIYHDTLTFVSSASDTTFSNSYDLEGDFSWKVRGQNWFSLWSDYSPLQYFELEE
jgi:hypothetical protein